MKIIKTIIISIMTLFTSLMTCLWFSGALNPVMGGCFDTTKNYGWPWPFYTTSGYYETCGDGFIAAEFHLWGLFIDILVLITIAYWIYFIYRKIAKK